MRLSLWSDELQQNQKIPKLPLASIIHSFDISAPFCCLFFCWNTKLQPTELSVVVNPEDELTASSSKVKRTDGGNSSKIVNVSPKSTSVSLFCSYNKTPDGGSTVPQKQRRERERRREKQRQTETVRNYKL